MPCTPKLAFLLADALPEAEPLPPSVLPAAVADVTELTAPVTVPARPTLPLAEPLCRSTEPLADPLAEPFASPLTLLVIDAGAPSAPERVRPTLPTLFTGPPTDPTLFSEPLTVPPSAPLTAPVTPPSSCASAGAAARTSAAPAKMNDFLISFSSRKFGRGTRPSEMRTTAVRDFIPALFCSDSARVDAARTADDPAADAALAGHGFGGEALRRTGEQEARGGERRGEAGPAHFRVAAAGKCRGHVGAGRGEIEVRRLARFGQRARPRIDGSDRNHSRAGGRI